MSAEIRRGPPPGKARGQEPPAGYGRTGCAHGERQRHHHQARKEGRPRRPSRRRVESRLCRLRDGDDGLLPADVAHQHDHPRTEARHCRLFRRTKHLANLQRFGRRSGRHGAGPGRGARGRHHVGLPEADAASALRSHPLARQRQGQWRRRPRRVATHPASQVRSDDHLERAMPSAENEQFASAAEAIHQAMQDMPDIAGTVAPGHRRPDARGAAHPARRPGRPAHVPGRHRHAHALYQEDAGGGGQDHRPPAQPHLRSAATPTARHSRARTARPTGNSPPRAPMRPARS